MDHLHLSNRFEFACLSSIPIFVVNGNDTSVLPFCMPNGITLTLAVLQLVTNKNAFDIFNLIGTALCPTW